MSLLLFGLLLICVVGSMLLSFALGVFVGADLKELLTEDDDA